MKRWFGGGNNKDAEKISTLKGMGFSAEQAREALKATSGDVQQAAEYLLSSSTTSGSNNNNNTVRFGAGSAFNTTGGASSNDSDVMMMMSEEEQLQQAMQQSLQMQQSSQQATASSNPSKSNRSAASIKAGQAALGRFQNSSTTYGANGIKKKKATSTTKSNNTSSTKNKNPSKSNSNNTNYKTTKFEHPNVKVPTKMSDKTKEEQILRCTQRLSTNSLAIDTLLKSFQTIRDNPNQDKYRKIDMTHAGFVRALSNVPGSLDLLKAVNFQPHYANPQQLLILERHAVDPALLYLAISALEQQRLSEEYQSDKALRVFQSQIKSIQDGLLTAPGISNMEEELVQRSAYLSKCPSEPSGGTGALLQITMAAHNSNSNNNSNNNNNNNTNTMKLSRKFDGDDTLNDILSFIGAHGSILPIKLSTKEWCIVDLNRYPAVPLNVELNRNKTLSFLGLWPSGKLEIRPSEDSWRDDTKEGKEDDGGDGGDGDLGEEKMGSSRGLNAAPSSVLS